MAHNLDFEKEGECRWMVRRNGLRLGLVLGAKRIYVAETCRGQHIGKATTRNKAADLLVAYKDKK